MFPTFLIALILSYVFRIFFSDITYLSVDWHQFCLSQTPPTSYPLYYQALVCGQKLSQSSEGWRLKNMGLIHLFVVSGAHLHFVDRMTNPLRKVKFGNWFRFVLLFCFVLCTAFPITAFRAWLFLSFQEINAKLKLHIPPLMQLLYSVIFCLFLLPDQFSSLALALSWMASLGLMVSKKPLYQSTFVYLFTLPLLLSFQFLSPWTILINTFLAPWVGALLFPLTFFSYPFPFITFYVDILWQGFDHLTLFSQDLLSEPTAPPNGLSTLALWLVCLSLHFAMQVWLRRREFP